MSVQVILIIDNGDGVKRYAIRPLEERPPVERKVRVLTFGIAKRCATCGEYPSFGECGCTEGKP